MHDEEQRREANNTKKSPGKSVWGVSIIELCPKKEESFRGSPILKDKDVTMQFSCSQGLPRWSHPVTCLNSDCHHCCWPLKQIFRISRFSLFGEGGEKLTGNNRQGHVVVPWPFPSPGDGEGPSRRFSEGPKERGRQRNGRPSPICEVHSCRQRRKAQDKT